MSAAFARQADLSMEDRILDATERLLARLGYQKTTMEDLAREAGISKRTVYFYFPSKEAVALASIDRVVARLCHRLLGIAAGPGSPESKLRAMLLVRVLHRFDSVRDYYHSLDELLATLRPAYLKRRQQYVEDEAAILAKTVADGMAQGIFVSGDADALARTLLTGTNSLLPYSLTAKELGKRRSIERQVGAIADLLLHGLMNASANAESSKRNHPTKGAKS